jgi:hypothetical protein
MGTRIVARGGPALFQVRGSVRAMSGVDLFSVFISILLPFSREFLLMLFPVELCVR